MKKRVYLFWSIFIAVALMRLWQSFYIQPPDIGKCLGEVVNGEGTIIQDPERKESGQIIIVSAGKLFIERLESGRGSEREGGEEDESDVQCDHDLLIKMKTKLYPKFSYNEQVGFQGKILLPSNFESEGREFDYTGYLAKDQIFYEMKSAQVFKVSTSSNISQTSFKEKIGQLTDISAAKLYSIKRSFVTNLEKTLGEPHAALASGLVVGEKAALGKDLLSDFRAVGLIHIVVLSGYNITIVADAMRRLLNRLPRVWGICIGAAGIVAFGIMVGGGATVVRSCVMASIALSADLIRREYNVMRALMLAGLIMIIENPLILLHDPSFQLSFMATLGLILLSSPVEKKLSFITEKFGMRGIVSSVIATQIFVSPYILYTMGQVSIIGVFANILVLPFIPLTMLFVSVAGLAGMLWLPVAQIISYGAYFLLGYELAIVRQFADLPLASIKVGVFSVWYVVCFYVLFFGAYIFLNSKKRQRKTNSTKVSVIK